MWEDRNPKTGRPRNDVVGTISWIILPLNFFHLEPDPFTLFPYFRCCRIRSYRVDNYTRYLQSSFKIPNEILRTAHKRNIIWSYFLQDDSRFILIQFWNTTFHKQNKVKFDGFKSTF